METFNDTMRVDRRTALKWVLAASAALQLPTSSLAQDTAKSVTGYGKDPNLLKLYKIGELWPLTLNDAQRATATVLSDLIIPADEQSPAAAKVGVVDFIDEWISAPYPDNQRDKPVVVQGLAWLDQESQRRFKNNFSALTEEERVVICDDISAAKAAAQFAEAAKFFARYRALTAGGYYTTPLGMKDLKYVGNVAMTTFEGPPPEVLKKLGLA
ncbi:gluconate 2-dehydrogenase subunit 3 family protein [Steroidobacter sp. S1-65]|uniref:Gluconate 2-dehydrogenase subunit 3 family protein n=1 Tax=Steroidobacter gossypii TaxID=2805490 RepID=A0ABS1WR40_9GAMM|nr:gluconate 2-dehydrogenase subunit 3 family protein [Steroidobacter gossypii]MBM0103432.1 gluconate 2-dehydrogenase subunit 3 family protein [Steroidobacter gossypii]